jgi:hypothetical protein
LNGAPAGFSQRPFTPASHWESTSQNPHWQTPALTSVPESVPAHGQAGNDGTDARARGHVEPDGR